MTWQDIAAVLYTEGALEETLHKVAPGAKHHHGKTKTHPLPHSHTCGIHIITVSEIPHQRRGSQHEDATTDAALPTLSRTNARKEFVLAEERTAAICAGVVDPQEDKHAQGQGLYIHDAIGGGTERKHIEQREGQDDIHLAHHRVGPIVDGIFLLGI